MTHGGRRWVGGRGGWRIRRRFERLGGWRRGWRGRIGGGWREWIFAGEAVQDAVGGGDFGYGGEGGGDSAACSQADCSAGGYGDGEDYAGEGDCGGAGGGERGGCDESYFYPRA